MSRQLGMGDDAMRFPSRIALMMVLAAASGVAAAEPAPSAKPTDGIAVLLRLCDAAHRKTAEAGAPPSSVDLDALRQAHAAEIADASTFKAMGLDRAAADKYLATPAGQRLLKDLGAADPSADANTIYARAVDQLSTGSDAPKLHHAGAVLVKIVPQGQSVSPYSPYFTTMAGLEAACRSRRRLADSFALPLKSEAASYDVYEIKPAKGLADSFASKIAPTTELDGLVHRQGGAMQYLVPNRGLWAAPVLLGTAAN